MSEDQIYQRMITTMGIESYDPLIISALDEYARRFAENLLCDAKDYASHRGESSDIEASDIKLAVHLHDSNSAGIPAKIKIIDGLVDKVNEQEVENATQGQNRVIRIPLKLQENLLQRSYTFVPGRESYPEKVDQVEDHNQEKTEYSAPSMTASSGPIKFKIQKKQKVS